MVNPHLMAAGILKAMDDGSRTSSIRVRPRSATSIRPWRREAGEETADDAGDALAALEKDPVIRSAMPGEMYRLYDEYKRDEWERFLHTVTEWDIKTYMDCLPRGAKSWRRLRQCAELPASSIATA